MKIYQEESKCRIEAQKQKREEERRKKQAMLAESLAGIVSLNSAIPNFVLQKQEKNERNGKTSLANVCFAISHIKFPGIDFVSDISFSFIHEIFST